MDVVDNQALHRFEAVTDAGHAIADYRLRDKTITFTHTEVPESMRGRGIAGILARAALDSARQRGLKVVPVCSYMSAFIRKHPEYQDLVNDV